MSLKYQNPLKNRLHNPSDPAVVEMFNEGKITLSQLCQTIVRDANRKRECARRMGLPPPAWIDPIRETEDKPTITEEEANKLIAQMFADIVFNHTDLNVSVPAISAGTDLQAMIDALETSVPRFREVQIVQRARGPHRMCAAQDTQLENILTVFGNVIEEESTAEVPIEIIEEKRAPVVPNEILEVD